MGTYYYIQDPEAEGGRLPVYEDDYIRAIFSIAQKRGLRITDEMILKEIKKNKKPINGKHQAKK